MKKKIPAKKEKQTLLVMPKRVQTAEGRRRAMLREARTLKAKAA
jgi:hypothetical protein